MQGLTRCSHRSYLHLLPGRRQHPRNPTLPHLTSPATAAVIEVAAAAGASAAKVACPVVKCGEGGISIWGRSLKKNGARANLGEG